MPKKVNRVGFWIWLATLCVISHGNLQNIIEFVQHVHECMISEYSTAKMTASIILSAPHTDALFELTSAGKKP